MTDEKTKAECRQIQVRLLDALKKICDKHNITNWIDFGTLLGAVRHKGFIPWDDDIDVSMPMKDYKRFQEIAEKELPRDIFLQTPKTDPPYNQTIIKLRDCYSTFMEHFESDKNTYHKGIYIDIFPSFYFPRMPRLLRKILLRLMVPARYKAFVSKKNVVPNFLVYIMARGVFSLFMLPFLMTNEVGQTPEDNAYNYSIPDTYIYPLKDIIFEGKMYPAPHDTHNYLSILYGKTYMTPLPPKDRIPHAKAVLPHTPCNHPRAMHEKNEKHA